MVVVVVMMVMVVVVVVVVVMMVVVVVVVVVVGVTAVSGPQESDGNVTEIWEQVGNGGGGCGGGGGGGGCISSVWTSRVRWRCDRDMGTGG